MLPVQKQVLTVFATYALIAIAVVISISYSLSEWARYGV